jgi:hypothetical protein
MRDGLIRQPQTIVPAVLPERDAAAAEAPILVGAGAR